MSTTDLSVLQNAVCEFFSTDGRNPFVSPFLEKIYFFASISYNLMYLWTGSMDPLILQVEVAP